MAAKPEASAAPAGWKPLMPSGAASTEAAQTLAALRRLTISASLAAPARTLRSKAASSPGPPHRSSAYHNGPLAACASTDATVWSRPGTAPFQSASTCGTKKLRHSASAARTSSPVIMQDHLRDSRHHLTGTSAYIGSQDAG